MKRIGLYLSAALLVFNSCDNQPTKKIDTSDLDTTMFLNEVQSIDSILSKGVPEKKDIKKAIVVYQDFANYYPNDPKSPDYLFQVSDFHLNSGNPDKAVEVLSTIIEKYPNYSRVEAVYFARASHTDLDLRDTTLAKTYYKEFLKMYPDSEYANDAKNRYENVGLSIEDIIKQFEENSAGN